MSRGFIAIAVACLGLAACGDENEAAVPPGDVIPESEFVTAEIPIEGVALSSDRARLLLQYTINSESELDHAEVEEGSYGVVVGLVGTVPGVGPHTLAATSGCVSIEAQLPERPKAVTDLATGRTLKVAPVVRKFKCRELDVE